MKRFISAILSTALVAALGTGAFAADKMKGDAMSSMSKTKTTCPAGKKWVKGYTKKDGTKVKGYCR